MYKVLFWTVLIYGSEIWVVTGFILKVIDDFHNRVARRILGKIDQHAGGFGWEWPPVREALYVSGMCPIKECIQSLNSAVAVHIFNRTIYELCEGAKNMTGSIMFMRWWDQNVGR